jgi:hypothetical protein
MLHLGRESLLIDVLIHIPTWLEQLIVFVALLYRRIRFGYAFRRIPLTQGKFAIVDPQDYDRLRKYKWHVQKSVYTYYAVHSLTNGKNAPRKNLQMHRLAMGLAMPNGINVPPGFYCDHINHNGLDNRKANLRVVTHKQNVWHRRKFSGRAFNGFKKPSRSCYKGVDWSKEMKRWRVRIRVNGKRIYLGSFEDEIAAAKAYDQAAKKYHGEHAGFNFALKL